MLSVNVDQILIWIHIVTPTRTCTYLKEHDIVDQRAPPTNVGVILYLTEHAQDIRDDIGFLNNNVSVMLPAP